MKLIQVQIELCDGNGEDPICLVRVYYSYVGIKVMGPTIIYPISFFFMSSYGAYNVSALF